MSDGPGKDQRQLTIGVEAPLRQWVVTARFRTLTFPMDGRGEMSYKVIVVGTDGSERAAVAVREALGLAKISGAQLHAVHMVHPAVAAGFADTRSAQFEVAGMREQVDKVKAQLLADAEREGVSIEVHTPGGDDAADAILSTAEAVDADLVVVGNRGMSGMARFVLGSVPNKIAHHCHCSVLIVDTDPS